MNTTTPTPIQLINKAKYLGYRLLIEDDYTVGLMNHENYTAEVYKDYEGQWGAQTTSYGTLSPEDIDLVIDGLKRAQELVKLLNGSGL